MIQPLHFTTLGMMHLQPSISFSLYPFAWHWYIAGSVIDLFLFTLTRGAIIEDEDGGVVTEKLHKPSQEKRTPHFAGNTIQSRSFNVLEETLAAGNLLYILWAWRGCMNQWIKFHMYVVNCPLSRKIAWLRSLNADSANAAFRIWQKWMETSYVFQIVMNTIKIELQYPQ